MLGAILYIIGCTARNRARRRLARLREPRYAVGAAAGLAYAVLSLYLRHRAFIDAPPAIVARETLLPVGPSAPAIGSLLLALAAAASWFMPFDSGLLRYSSAEVALLFPAPMTRRQILMYRLLRSQLAVLLGAIIFALAYPTGSIAARGCGLAGAWMLLMLAHVFFTGVTLARTTLRRDPRARHALMSWLGFVVSVAPVVGLAATLALKLAEAPIATMSEAFGLLTEVASGGVLRALLSPYLLAVGPLLAPGGAPFVQAMLGAVLLYALAILWMTSVHASTDSADGAVVDGSVSAGRRASYAVRPLDIPLEPRGRAEFAFLWKGALQTFRVVDRRVLVRVVLLVAWAGVAAALVSRARGVAQLLGLFAAWATAFTVLMAPQVVRLDLRQDLEYLDLLKTWPLPGRVVLRGEILWPTLVVSVFAWLFGGMAWLLAESAFGAQHKPLVHALAAATMILTPAIIAVQYTVHNGIAVLLPAWVPSGPLRPRGVDAMGQRLILLGATWVLLATALIPTAVLAAAFSSWFDPELGAWVLPPAALVGGGIVWLEVYGATHLLGRAFDRLDLTSIERAD